MNAASASRGKASSPRPGTTQLRVGRLTKAHGLKGASSSSSTPTIPNAGSRRARRSLCRCRRHPPGTARRSSSPNSAGTTGTPSDSSQASTTAPRPRPSSRRSSGSTTMRPRCPTSRTPGTTTSWSACAPCATASRSGRVARVDHLPAQDLLAIATADRRGAGPVREGDRADRRHRRRDRHADPAARTLRGPPRRLRRRSSGRYESQRRQPDAIRSRRGLLRTCPTRFCWVIDGIPAATGDLAAARSAGPAPRSSTTRS